MDLACERGESDDVAHDTSGWPKGSTIRCDQLQRRGMRLPGPVPAEWRVNSLCMSWFQNCTRGHQQRSQQGADEWPHDRYGSIAPVGIRLLAKRKKRAHHSGPASR